jgi:hypothetical protein
MSGIWWFPVILAQRQSQAACLINFSKLESIVGAVFGIAIRLIWPTPTPGLKSFS